MQQTRASLVALAASLSLCLVAGQAEAFKVIVADAHRPGLDPSDRYFSKIVRDSKGTLFVAYSLHTNQSVPWFNYVSSSDDGGATWSAGVRTETMPDSNEVGSLVVGPGDVLYQGFKFNVATFFNRSSDGGKTWTSPYSLNDVAGYSWTATLALDDKGNLDAVFPGNTSGGGWYSTDLYHRTSTDGGDTWSSSENVSKVTAPQSSWPAELAAGRAGELFLFGNVDVDVNRNGPSANLWVREGGSWKAPVPVAPGAEAQSYDIAVDSKGRAHLVYGVYGAGKKAALTYAIYDHGSLSSARTLTDAGEGVFGATIGVYDQDRIVIAYDLYDPSTSKWAGVYARFSDDDFASGRKLSTHAEARGPNLRSSTYFLHEPARIDITWIEPNDATSGEDLVYDELSTGVQAPKRLMAKAFLPKVVNPGQEVTALVRVDNDLGVTAQGAVAVLEAPVFMGFRSASDGGFVQKDARGNQIVWQLGDLPAGKSVSLVARLDAPGGLPSGTRAFVAHAVAQNAPARIDAASYGALASTAEKSHNDMAKADLDQAYAQDPALGAMRQHLQGLGLIETAQAREVTLASGDASLRVVFVSDKGEATTLVRAGGRVFAERHEGTKVVTFDRDGGVERDTVEGTSKAFGTWAEEHSLSYAKCVTYCTLNKVPGWAADIATSSFDKVKKSLDCAKCAATKDPDACAKCAQIYKELPGYDQAKDVGTCIGECMKDSNKWLCSDDKLGCEETWSFFGGPDSKTTLVCNKTIGKYDDIVRRVPCPPQSPYCRFDASGKPGCYAGYELCDLPAQPKNPAPDGSSSATGTCTLDDFEVTPAHDPNAKHGPSGDVVPGQRLDYVIEYENTGAGTAFGVFVLDKLDESLDASGVSFDGKGDYTESGRLCSFDVGDLTPGQKGQVGLHVSVKKGLPSGTKIINGAEVHFPSANEITPTNTVVSVVKDIAAMPLSVTGQAGKPIAIKLSGADAGGGKVTYRIASPPLHGTLSGSAPDLTYTADIDHAGADELTYAVSNGQVESDLAAVRIDVSPAPGNAPKVLAITPSDGSKKVRFSTEPVGDGVYGPAVRIELSKPVDPLTLSFTTALIDKVDTAMRYDADARTITLRPKQPLSPATTYEVQVSKLVTDLSGKGLDADVKARFTTAAQRSFTVSLPDRAAKLLVAGTAEGRVVSLQSDGLSALSVKSLSLTGPDAASFSLDRDQCTGKQLTPGDECTVRVQQKEAPEATHTAQLVITTDASDTATATVDIEGKAGPAAAAPGAGASDDGGCGCETPGGQRGAGLWAVALAALAWLSRRARRA